MEDDEIQSKITDSNASSKGGKVINKLDRNEQ